MMVSPGWATGDEPSWPEGNLEPNCHFADWQHEAPEFGYHS
jgi:hypothetical protein